MQAQMHERVLGQRDWVVAGLAWFIVVPGVVGGWGPAAVVVAISALTVSGFRRVGHPSGRAAVAGCAALALFTAIWRSPAGLNLWSELALLSGLLLVSLIGGIAVDRFVPPGPVTPFARDVPVGG